ncbi:hypothetical protein CMV_020574 [Castanea mollissima]|uniref:Pyrrolidone-carboxylate peptidase n=1 Tax=Castanea mollissima TaxID=60419 RepID=A0A8J4QMY0_9ROSI|nr:hypothetical protein CMV_020574 [Castanea mollissima]
MGSEGPLAPAVAVTVHVTGFKKFHGISENPTETIVSNLKEYVKKKGLPKGLTLGSCFPLHFGVNSGATRFAVEHQAVNEATFRCPDELGWKPQKVPIIPADGDISHTRQTSLPVEEITKALAKMGYEVMTSDDVGRFVCNHAYYHSLQFAEQNGNKSLFVHVPLFLTIDEDTQMQFAASLLETYFNPQIFLSWNHLK